MGILKKIKYWMLLRKIKAVMRYEQRNKIIGTLEEYNARNEMVDKAIYDYGVVLLNGRAKKQYQETMAYLKKQLIEANKTLGERNDE